MGILTDLFVASSEELRASFPYRVPVNPEPIIRMSKNPFTGKPTTIKQWAPSEPFPGDWQSQSLKTAEHERNSFRGLPHREYKGVDWLMLSALWIQLRGGDMDEHMDFLTRPALLAPGDPDDWVHRLPDDLVSALADLPQADVSRVAVGWASCEELDGARWTPADACEVLVGLCELSKTAVTAQKGLYLWVGL
jgi:hypothetical protein